MKNPNLKYYQIPSKSQLSNPKTMEAKIYDIRERVFSFAQRVLEIAEKLPQKERMSKIGSVGILDLFGSIGIYLDLGIF